MEDTTQNTTQVPANEGSPLGYHQQGNLTIQTHTDCENKDYNLAAEVLIEHDDEIGNGGAIVVLQNGNIEITDGTGQPVCFLHLGTGIGEPPNRLVIFNNNGARMGSVADGVVLPYFVGDTVARQAI